MNNTDIVLFKKPCVIFVPVSKRTPLLINREWHLDNLNTKFAWNKNITGKSVTVCVNDSGLYPNPDLEFINDPFVNPVSNDINDVIDDSHGTSVAGIICARGFHNIIGIAPDAKLRNFKNIGVNSLTDEQLRDFMIVNKDLIDIFNNSWGFGDPISNPTQITPNVKAVLDGFEECAKNGRNGKGCLITVSSGNESSNNDQSGFDPLCNTRFVIVVGAVKQNLELTSYSEFGASILCTAPGAFDLFFDMSDPNLSTFEDYGITTTTPAIRNLLPFTHSFNGTSAACPMVSGSIALLLDYKPELTWRDVKEIISRSCYQNSTTDLFENADGRIISVSNGYGFVNIKNMFELADSWTLLPPERNAFAEQTYDENLPGNQLQNNIVVKQLNIIENMIIETVQLYLSININLPPNKKIIDIRIDLTSPSGTTITLIRGIPMLPYTETEQFYDAFPILCEHLRGENSMGTWTVTFTDEQPLDGINAKLSALSLDIYGH